MKLFGRKNEDDISQHIQNLEIKQGIAPTPNFQTQTMQKTNFTNPFEEDLTIQKPNNTQDMNNPNNPVAIPQTSGYYQSQPMNQNFNENANMQMQPQKDQIPLANQNLQFNQNHSDLNNYSELNNFSSKEMANSQKQVTQEDIQEMIDETIEKLVEEKWETIVENVAKIAAWKEKQEAEMKSLKDDLLIIKDNFEKLEKKLSNRISDYDKNILDVNSEIKALEKVFQKITPTLVNNVNELSKIAQDLKSLKPQGDKELQGYRDTGIQR